MSRRTGSRTPSPYARAVAVIALDNDVPEFALDAVAVTLTPEERLVRVGDRGNNEPDDDESVGETAEPG